MKAFDNFAKEITGQVGNENEILHNKKVSLEAELAKTNELIAAIEPKRGHAVAYKSDQNFCPFCFIHNGISVEMKPIPSDSENDIFKCSHCSSEIEVKNG